MLKCIILTELYDISGEPVEGALTKEEVDAKIAEATDGIKTELEQAASGKILDLQSQLEEAISDRDTKAADLTKLQSKDFNFGRLRESKEEAEKRVNDVKTELLKEIGGLKTAIAERTIKDIALEKVGGNKEMADKVVFHYKTFGGEPKDDKEKEERLDKAILLAGGSKSVGLPAGSLSSGGGYTPSAPAGQGKLSEGGVEVAKKMGITDEELKKSKLV